MRELLVLLKEFCMVIIIFLVVLIMSTESRAEDKHFEFTGLGISKHIYPTYKEDGVDKEYNGNHNLFGIEYRDYDYGYSALTFKNSYYDQSYMVLGNAYFHPTDYLEVITSAGLVHGYEGRNACIGAIGPLCSVVAVGFQLNTFKVKPRITWFGTAFILTVTMEF